MTMFEIFRYTQNDKGLFVILSLCEVSKNSLHWHTDSPCHTETLAEVSINLKSVLNSVDISPAAQYDNIEFCCTL